MEVLNILWQLYLEGYTFEYWFPTAWMIVINAAIALSIMHLFIR